MYYLVFTFANITTMSKVLVNITQCKIICRYNKIIIQHFENIPVIDYIVNKSLLTRKVIAHKFCYIIYNSLKYYYKLGQTIFKKKHT